MTIRELTKFLQTIIEGIAELVLTKPKLNLRGKTIKKYIPSISGFLYVDSFKLDLVNYAPIVDDEEYTVVVTKYVIEIRDKDNNLVQEIKGEYIKEDKA